MRHWTRLGAGAIALTCALALFGSPRGLMAGSSQAGFPPSVRVLNTAMFGPILVDKDGYALYTWVLDQPPSSGCYDTCATFWPPATVEGAVVPPAGLPGRLGTTARTDGTVQLTYNGRPLYRWMRDTEPGMITGDGSLSSGGLWPVATTGAVTPAVQLGQNQQFGYILTDRNGMTLYTNANDPQDQSACSDACTAAWPPLLVSGNLASGTLIVGAGLSRVLDTIQRADGATQVTFNHQPLYTFRRDMQPGDATGQGSTGFGGAWSVAVMKVTP